MSSMIGLRQAERVQYAERDRARQRAEAADFQDARRELAHKIVSVMVDRINQEIVRPGPISEERECYEIAQELRDFSPTLMEIVVDQINVNGGCQ